jgi:hypothetical protein
MKALRQLGFLKLSLRPERPSDEEDDRVLELFRNRAELKKAYGGLQDETYRLKDLIKQQEGATQRVQEMLSALEVRLGDPDSAYDALVFYQLRRLWQSGRELITGFVSDLAQQQEERERRAHLATHNRQQFAKRQVAEERVAQALVQQDEAIGEVQRLEAERATLTRFWHYFRRRALERRVHAAHGAANQARLALGDAQGALEDISRIAAPEFPGISLPARRSINLAAIAYAEVLCLRVATLKAPLVKLAQEATAQREVTDTYGNPQECVLLMGQITRAHKLIAAKQGLSEEIRVRSERLKQVARYRGANDGSPVTDSIASSEGDVLAGQPVGAHARALPNVLADDVWDLFRILLR